MRLLILSPYPYQIAPSQRFRYEQYLSKLSDRGIDYDLAPFISLKTWKVLHTPGNFVNKALGILGGFWQRLILCFRLGKYDYVFIHREASHIGPPIFEWLMARVFGKKIIYDFDDAIWMPNYSSHNAAFHRLKYYKKVNSVMKWAHRISAGNQYLCEYAAQFNKRENIVHLPTTIDTENYHNRVKEHHRGKLLIGWTGTLTTAKYVESLLPVLKRLEEKYDFEFRMISNEHPGYELRRRKSRICWSSILASCPWKKTRGPRANAALRRCSTWR